MEDPTGQNKVTKRLFEAIGGDLENQNVDHLSEEEVLALGPVRFKSASRQRQMGIPCTRATSGVKQRIRKKLLVKFRLGGYTHWGRMIGEAIVGLHSQGQKRYMRAVRRTSLTSLFKVHSEGYVAYQHEPELKEAYVSFLFWT